MRGEVVALREEHIAFVRDAMRENEAALHAGSISLEEWRACLLANDPDEAHFIVLADGAPAAWLKLNGLLNKTVWISMLVVQKPFQRGGLGSFAVRFAEEFARARGFAAMQIQTTADNAPARQCYAKLGYHVIEEAPNTFGDGVARPGVVLRKILTQ